MRSLPPKVMGESKQGSGVTSFLREELGDLIVQSVARDVDGLNFEIHAPHGLFDEPARQQKILRRSLRTLLFTRRPEGPR